MAKIISFKKYPDLLCNHNGAQFVNLGYSVGITSNGVPYEAELWHDDKCLCIGVVVPFIKEFGEMNTEPAPKKALPKVINFRRAKEATEKESTDNITEASGQNKSTEEINMQDRTFKAGDIVQHLAWIEQ